MLARTICMLGWHPRKSNLHTPRETNLKIYPLIAVLLTLSTMTQAGPIREVLKERLAARQSDWYQDSDFETQASPGKLPQEVRVLHDLAYGSDPKQRMDVYLPAKADHAPVIFMVHGGAWRTGDKSMARVTQNKIQRWVPRGFVFVSVNYRLLPKADPLTQMKDVALALATAQSKAVSWGADPARFILMGHSAGAHLVDLLAANPDSTLTRWLGTISLDSAAMDIVQIMQSRHYPFYDKAFGKDPAYWQAASPLHQLSRSATPMLLVCSSTRPDSPCTQAQQFADKAHALGLRTEISMQAKKHSEINEELGIPGTYTDVVEAFMASLDPQVKQRLAQ